MVNPRFFQQSFEKCLEHVIEECGEVVAAGAKTLRWGAQSVNPLLPPDKQETNLQWLEREIFDLEIAIMRLKGEIVIQHAELAIKK